MAGFSHIVQGRLIKRYKRFFAEIELEDSTVITAHCPNPGKMLGLLAPGTPALVTALNDPQKALQYRLEALAENGVWVGVNTQWPNRVIARAIADGLIPALSGYAILTPERKYGHNSRIDLYAAGHAFNPDAYIEIKNVHFSRTPGLAEFPDCVTERGTKHLYELIEIVRTGYRAAVVFCVQRPDCVHFTIARDCDPGFGRAFDAARASGVEFFAVGFEVRREGLRFCGPLDVQG